MMAVRSSEPAALTSGGSSLGPRLALFGVSAAIAGFGGALLAANNLRITGTDFPTQTGLFWIAVMVVFGVRRIGGALLAGLLSYLFPELLSHLTTTTLLPPILFGMGAMTLAQQPDGFMAVVGLSRQAKRARRALRQQLSADEDTPEPSVDVAEGEVAELSVPAVAGGAASNGDQRKPALALHGISAGYEGMMVLHDLDLEVSEGSFVAIIGPNGAGKSTLCSVVAGLHAPAKGQVWVHGRDVTTLPAHRRARDDLFLAPEYRGIFPGLSVEENLAVWLRDPAQRRAAMERFPVLGERRKFQAELLSGGEQQLLTLATALERPPRLLVLDEPSLGLSPIASGQVFDTLAELHSGGTTVVVVEEQAKRAAELADTVMLLDLGRVRWHGPATEFTAQAAKELYLGSAKGS
jgi:ABC-type branched-subunit amino acid transport system ATPase component